jgi:gas vesicle protein
MSTKNKTGFWAFLLGGTLGAALGLLYAPRSGEETRQLLVDEGQEVADKTMSAIHEAQDNAMSTIDEAQARVKAMSDDVKQRLAKLGEITKDTWKEQKESLSKGYSSAKEVVAES